MTLLSLQKLAASLRAFSPHASRRSLLSSFTHVNTHVATHMEEVAYFLRDRMQNPLGVDQVIKGTF